MPPMIVLGSQLGTRPNMIDHLKIWCRREKCCQLVHSPNSIHTRLCVQAALMLPWALMQRDEFTAAVDARKAYNGFNAHVMVSHDPVHLHQGTPFIQRLSTCTAHYTFYTSHYTIYTKAVNLHLSLHYHAPVGEMHGGLYGGTAYQPCGPVAWHACQWVMWQLAIQRHFSSPA